MTQRELNRAVAQATGESLSTIGSIGFVPLTVGPVEREPLVVDWDELDEQRRRPLLRPGRCRAT